MANKNNGLTIGIFLKYLNSKSPTSAYSILIFTAVVISLLQSEAIKAQQISPFQTGHFMPAFANIRDFTKMQPGLVVISYNYYAWGDKFADRNGQKHDEVFLEKIDPDLPPVAFSVDVTSGLQQCLPCFGVRSLLCLEGPVMWQALPPVIIGPMRLWLPDKVVAILILFIQKMKIPNFLDLVIYQ